MAFVAMTVSQLLREQLDQPVAFEILNSRDSPP